MLNNLMLNRKVDFSEDLSGKCSHIYKKACSHSLLDLPVSDFLDACYLHPTVPLTAFEPELGAREQ